MPNADHVMRDGRRTCQQTEKVQTRSNTEPAANICDAAQLGMKFRSEKKGHAAPAQARLRTLSIGSCFYAEFAEDVRASRFAHYTAVALFRDRQPCTCGDDRRRRRHIKCLCGR